MAKLIEGKNVAKEIYETLSDEVLFFDKKPYLAVIIVGSDPASQIYVNLKKKKAVELGIDSDVIALSENISQEELLQKIDELNKDNKVTGILVQLPLPKHIDTHLMIEKIDHLKDVDCFNPYNVGQIATGHNPCVYPCTPKGIIRLLEYYDISIDGKNVVVVGRSNIVGRPLAQMFLNKDATVTVCNSKTKNLGDITKSAYILVCSEGK